MCLVSFCCNGSVRTDCSDLKQLETSHSWGNSQTHNCGHLPSPLYDSGSVKGQLTGKKSGSRLAWRRALESRGLYKVNLNHPYFLDP